MESIPNLVKLHKNQLDVVLIQFLAPAEGTRSSQSVNNYSNLYKAHFSKIIFSQKDGPFSNYSGCPNFNSGFVGLVVSMLASGTQDGVFAPGRRRRIFRKGSKPVCPMSQICDV
jgi:hypothetical protein